jgi:hypothetical protein
MGYSHDDDDNNNNNQQRFNQLMLSGKIVRYIRY